jgi:hypothetical protein
MPTPTQIIDNALRALGPNGEHWCQHTLWDDRGRVCLIGALRKSANIFVQWSVVTAKDEDFRIAFNAVSDVLRSEYGQQEPTVWNDQLERTFPEVRAVLEKAKANLGENTF